MPYVKNLLERKGNTVWTILPGASIRDALLLMTDKKVGALVVSEAGKICGIFSERDYARQVAKTDNLSLDLPVSAVMSHPVYFARPDQTVEECMRIMTARRIRHLPVLQDDALAGIISIGDVVKSLINEKEMTIRHLENFIAGSSVSSSG
ncbi:MAG: CBS domain-containing protein [Anaerolineaceae bacterium]|jgi:CBS domain-containing protein